MLIPTLLAAAASASQANLPEWMAGHWLQCGIGNEVSETWTDARGDMLLGMSKTVGRRTRWEYSRIARTEQGISFFAEPSGQQPTEFRATEIAVDRIIFENPDHDYPQRLIYRREGNSLVARIEGMTDGRQRSTEWRYTLSAFNATCPHIRD